MKKTIIRIIASLLVILLPFASVISLAAFLPSQFDQTFVGALSLKYERLSSLDEPKMVLIGGSSVAFGYDSELLESYVGMPVVNFGLYAALGTKVMLDLAEGQIGEGDVVVLAPELDAQTLSLYFNSETTLQALDGNMSLFFELDPENWFQLLGGMWKFVTSKIEYMNKGKPDPTGVYNSRNFNSYGDVSYERSENIMFSYYDPNSIITLTEDIVDSEFLTYINEFIETCEKKGATVYFTYCPINEMGLDEATTEESLEAFTSYLESNLACEIISDIQSSIMDAGYFYDTNFHLNDTGVTYRTINLIKDLLLAIGIPKRVEESLPEAPSLPQQQVRLQGTDENAKYFEFEQLDSGAYKIIGLSELGKTQRELTLPVNYNDYIVAVLGRESLTGGVLETLIVPEDSKLRTIQDDAFLNSNLKELQMLPMDAETILPPKNFNGTSQDFSVWIQSGANYPSDYFWSELGLTFNELP